MVEWSRGPIDVASCLKIMDSFVLYQIARLIVEVNSSIDLRWRQTTRVLMWSMAESSSAIKSSVSETLVYIKTHQSKQRRNQAKHGDFRNWRGNT